MRIPHAAALLLPFFACRGQTPNYTANYKAQFANYLATTCQSAPPVIHVACQGDLFITETSHPTIDCSQAPLKDENGWNFIECTNSCQGTECLDAWQADPDVTPLHDISYGEIVFECSGDDIKNVDAYTSQEGGDVGVCTEDEALNIRIARLGVQCGDEYDFDDFYFECASNGVALNTAQYIYSDDSQACVSGFVCQVDPVTKMCDDIFGRIQVKADHEEFQKSCVQAKPGAPVIPEASSPDVPEVDATFKATFRAGWLFRFYGDMFGLDCTLSQTVRIQCVEGEFEPIKKELEINCGNLDSSSITCNGQTMNDFSELEFSCTRYGRYPEAMVTYLGGNVSCNSVPTPLSFFQAVQLNIQCGGGDISAIADADRYVECGEKSNQFAKLNDNGNSGNRWTCAEGVEVPSSFSPSLFAVKEVSIETDGTWLTSAPPLCVEQLDSSEDAPAIVAERESDGSTNTGAIVGGVFGSLAGVALATGLVFFWKRKRPYKAGESTKTKDLAHSDEESEANEMELPVVKSIPA